MTRATTTLTPPVGQTCHPVTAVRGSDCYPCTGPGHRAGHRGPARRAWTTPPDSNGPVRSMLSAFNRRVPAHLSASSRMPGTAGSAVPIACHRTRRDDTPHRSPTMIGGASLMLGYSVWMGRRVKGAWTQLPLRPRTWGGSRPGAGRSRTPGSGVPHRPRPAITRHEVAHVTVRLRPVVATLRNGRSFRVVRGCLAAARERFGFRLVEFSLQGQHLHLVCEAEDRRSLARGMQGLGVRLAGASTATSIAPVLSWRGGTTAGSCGRRRRSGTSSPTSFAIRGSTPPSAASDSSAAGSIRSRRDRTSPAGGTWSGLPRRMLALRARRRRRAPGSCGSAGGAAASSRWMRSRPREGTSPTTFQ